MKIEIGTYEGYEPIDLNKKIRITLDDGNEIVVSVKDGKICVNKTSWNEYGEINVIPSASNQIYIK